MYEVAIYSPVHPPPKHFTMFELRAIIGRLSHDDNNGSENIAKKSKLYRTYLDKHNWSNVADFASGLQLLRTDPGLKGEFVVACSRPP